MCLCLASEAENSMQQGGDAGAMANFLTYKTLSLDAAAAFANGYGAADTVDIPEIVVVHQAKVVTEWLAAQAGKPARSGSGEASQQPAARIWQLLGSLLRCKYTSPHLQVPVHLVQGIVRDCGQACLQPTDDSSVQLANALDQVLQVLHTKFEHSWRPTLEQLSSVLQALLQVVITLQSSAPGVAAQSRAYSAWTTTATTACNTFRTTCAMHPVPRKVFSSVVGRLLPCLLECCCPPHTSTTSQALSAACAAILQQAFFNTHEISGVSSCLEQAAAPLFNSTAAPPPAIDTQLKEAEGIEAGGQTAEGSESGATQGATKGPAPSSYHKGLLQGIQSLLSRISATQDANTAPGAAVRSLPHFLEWFVAAWRRHAKAVQSDAVKSMRAVPDGQSGQDSTRAGMPEFNMVAWLLDQLLQQMVRISRGEEDIEAPVEPSRKKRKTAKGERKAADMEGKVDDDQRHAVWASLAEAAAKVVITAKDLQAYQPSKDVSGAHRAFLTRFAQQLLQQCQAMWEHTGVAVAGAGLAAALLDLEIRCISAETDVLWQLCWQAAAAPPHPTPTSTHPPPTPIPVTTVHAASPHDALHLACRLLIAALETRQLQAALERLMHQMTGRLDPHACMVLCDPLFVDTLMKGVGQVPPGQKAGLVAWVADQMRLCAGLPDCPPELALPVAEVCTCILQGVMPDMSTAPLVHKAAVEVVSALADPLGQLIGVCLALETVVQPVLLQLWLRVFQGAVRLTSHCSCLLPSLDPLPGQGIKPAGNDSISALALQPLTHHYFQSLLPSEETHTSSSAMDASSLLNLVHLITADTPQLRTTSAADNNEEPDQQEASGVGGTERVNVEINQDVGTKGMANGGGSVASKEDKGGVGLSKTLLEYAHSSVVLSSVVSILQRLYVLQERHVRLSHICPLITLRQAVQPSADAAQTVKGDTKSSTPARHTQKGGVHIEREGDEDNNYYDDKEDNEGVEDDERDEDDDVDMSDDDDQNALDRDHPAVTHTDEQTGRHKTDDDEDMEEVHVVDVNNSGDLHTAQYTDTHFGEGPSELDELFRQALLGDIEREASQLVEQLLQLFCTLAIGRAAPKSKSQAWPSGTWAALLAGVPSWNGLVSATSAQQVVLAVWMMMGESMPLWWRYCLEKYTSLCSQSWLDASTCHLSFNTPQNAAETTAQRELNNSIVQSGGVSVSQMQARRPVGNFESNFASIFASNFESIFMSNFETTFTRKGLGATRQAISVELQHRLPLLPSPPLHSTVSHSPVLDSQMTHNDQRKGHDYGTFSAAAVLQLHLVSHSFKSWTTTANFSQSLVSFLPSALSSSLLQLLQLILLQDAANTAANTASKTVPAIAVVVVGSKAARKLVTKAKATIGAGSAFAPVVALAAELAVDGPHAPPALLHNVLAWLQEHKTTFRKSSKRLKAGGPERDPGGRDHGQTGQGQIPATERETAEAHDNGKGHENVGRASSVSVAWQLLQVLQMMRMSDLLARLDVQQLQDLVSGCLVCAAAAAGVIIGYLGMEGGTQLDAVCGAWRQCYGAALDGAADGMQWMQHRQQDQHGNVDCNEFLSKCQHAVKSLQPTAHLLLAHCLADTNTTAASCLVDSWGRLCRQMSYTPDTGQPSLGKKGRSAKKSNRDDELHPVVEALVHQTIQTDSPIKPDVVAARWLNAAELCPSSMGTEHGPSSVPVSTADTSRVIQAVRRIAGQSTSLTPHHTLAVQLACPHLVLFAAQQNTQQIPDGHVVGQSQPKQDVLQALPLIASLLNREATHADQVLCQADRQPSNTTSRLHLLRALVSLAPGQGTAALLSLLSLSASILQPTHPSLLLSAATAKDSIATLVGSPSASRPSFSTAYTMALDAASALDTGPFTAATMLCQATAAACSSVLQGACTTEHVRDTTTGDEGDDGNQEDAVMAEQMNGVAGSPGGGEGKEKRGGKGGQNGGGSRGGTRGHEDGDKGGHGEGDTGGDEEGDIHVKELAQGFHQDAVCLLIKVLSSSTQVAQLHAAAICCAVLLDAPRGSPLLRAVSMNSSKLCTALCTVLANCSELNTGVTLQHGTRQHHSGFGPNSLKQRSAASSTAVDVVEARQNERDGQMPGDGDGVVEVSFRAVQQNERVRQVIGDGDGMRKVSFQASVVNVACSSLHCLETMLGRPSRFKLAGSMVLQVLSLLPGLLMEGSLSGVEPVIQTRWADNVVCGSMTVVAICQTLIAMCRQHSEHLARGMALMVDVQRAVLNQLAAWALKPDLLLQHGHLVDKCADALCRVWEVLAEHKSSLGKYCLHFLPDYLNLLTLGPSGSPPVAPRYQLLWQPGLTALAPASPAQALRRGAYSLMACLSSHDLQYLHALGGQGRFSPTYREALAELKKDFDRHFKYEGKV